MELNANEDILVKIKTASCPTNTLPEHDIKRYKQQKWTLKNCQANSFYKDPPLQSLLIFSILSIRAYRWICCVINTLF